MCHSEQNMSQPAIFLDRDGTLNVDKGYVYKPEDWEWVPGSYEALREFKKMGFLLIVVTNQGGAAKGLYGDAEINKLHEYINQDLSGHGVRIDDFYYCPHYPGIGEDCECRKPKPGMIRDAAKKWNIDLSRSFMIGDKPMDMELGENAGVQPILVTTGYGRQHKAAFADKIPVAGNLLAAMQYIKNTVNRDS
jgi:D-glycero-D-manno-heptose 1,7-bisphosphate phosphatase